MRHRSSCAQVLCECDGRTSSSFRTITGAGVLDELWQDLQPNNKLPPELGVFMTTSVDLSDEPLSVERSSICECDRKPLEPFMFE